RRPARVVQSLASGAPGWNRRMRPTEHTQEARRHAWESRSLGFLLLNVTQPKDLASRLQKRLRIPVRGSRLQPLDRVAMHAREERLCCRFDPFPCLLGEIGQLIPQPLQLRLADLFVLV